MSLKFDTLCHSPVVTQMIYKLINVHLIIIYHNGEDSVTLTESLLYLVWSCLNSKYAVKPTECFVLNSLEFLLLMKLGGHISGHFKVYSFEYEKFVDKINMQTKSHNCNVLSNT